MSFLTFETLTTIAAVATAVTLLYVKFKGLVSYSRELSNSREERIALYGLVGAIALLIGSCVAVERVTGISPYSTPSSFVVRRSLAAIFLVGYIAFVWWATVYPESQARSRLVVGRTCGVCNRPMSPRRLHRPTLDDDEQPSTSHWFHRCECGDMTLFDVQGRASHVDDRSHSQPAS